MRICIMNMWIYLTVKLNPDLLIRYPFDVANYIQYGQLSFFSLTKLNFN